MIHATHILQAEWNVGLVNQNVRLNKRFTFMYISDGSIDGNTQNGCGGKQ